MALVPPYLAEGDTILIIATARARNQQAIQPAITILESWGLKVETGAHLFKVHNQFAGTDGERTEDLQWALDHESAKAILIAGGGYGALRIIDRVDFSKFSGKPKWVVGYSDTTVIHNRLLKMEIACIHGTMAFQFLKNEAATFSIRQLLFGSSIKYKIIYNPLNREGEATAEVVGGNLSLIYALSGGPEDLDTKDKILFIEDLDEQLYHVDRMMLQLKRSGKLGNVVGLVVGGMSDMKDNAIAFGKTAEEIIIDAVKEYDFPVCFDFPAGHIENNMALYLGRRATLVVDRENASLKYL